MYALLEIIAPKKTSKKFKTGVQKYMQFYNFFNGTFSENLKSIE